MTIYRFWLLVFSGLCFLSFTTQDASLAPPPSAVTVIVAVHQDVSTEKGSSSSWLMIFLFITSVVFFITSTVLLLQKYKLWPFTAGKVKKKNDDDEIKKIADYRRYISKLSKDTEVITGLKKDAPSTQTTTSFTISATPTSTPASSAVPKESQPNSSSISSSATLESSTLTKSTEVSNTITSQTPPSPPLAATASSQKPQTAVDKPLKTVIVNSDQGQTTNVKTLSKTITTKKTIDGGDKSAGKSTVFKVADSVERFYSISEGSEPNRENSEAI